MSAIAGVVATDAAAGPGIRIHADSRLDDALTIRDAYARWGDACPEHLLGDFAFVLVDETAGRILAARDPLGVKPLHYHLTEGRLAFATRVWDLLSLPAVPRVLDERRIVAALVPELEGIDATSTFFRGILRLPPGHRLVVDRAGARVSRYWFPDARRELRLSSDAEYADAFLSTFREAVRCRLDGSTAAMVSGGLDSSAIAGIARLIRRDEGAPPPVTLSAVVRGAEEDEETRHVRAVLAGGEYDPVLVEPDAAAALEPPADPFDAGMLLPDALYAAARRRGLTSVLDGVDGDVVASLEPDYLDALLRAGRFVTAASEARGLAAFYRGTYPPWSRAPRLLAAGAYRALAPRAWRRRPHARRGLVRPEIAARTGLPERLEALAAQRWSDAARDPRERHARELTHPYLSAALERYHRVADRHGIEARHPFLDRRVVEMCLALPWDLKVRRGWSKWIVRRSLEGVLPEEVLWRRGRWVHLGPRFLRAALDGMGSRVDVALADNVSALAPYVDLDELAAVRRRYSETRALEYGETLWRVANLALWLSNAARPLYDARAARNEPAALSRKVATQHDALE